MVLREESYYSQKGFVKKIISLTTLVLIVLLCSFINVSAKNLADVSIQEYPAYEVIPLKVEIQLITALMHRKVIKAVIFYL